MLPFPFPCPYHLPLTPLMRPGSGKAHSDKRNPAADAPSLTPVLVLVPRSSPIPRRLPLALSFHKRSLLILILIAHPPASPARARARPSSFPIDPPTPTPTPTAALSQSLSLTMCFPPRTTNLPHHRPRLPLLLPSNPLRIPRLAFAGVLIDFRSAGRGFRSPFPLRLSLRLRDVRRRLLLLFPVAVPRVGSIVVVVGS